MINSQVHWIHLETFGLASSLHNCAPNQITSSLHQLMPTWPTRQLQISTIAWIYQDLSPKIQGMISIAPNWLGNGSRSWYTPDRAADPPDATSRRQTFDRGLRLGSERRLLVLPGLKLNTMRPRQNGHHLADDVLNAFSSWMEISEFWLKLHWSLLRRVQLTICQHWFR